MVAVQSHREAATCQPLHFISDCRINSTNTKRWAITSASCHNLTFSWIPVLWFSWPCMPASRRNGDVNSVALLQSEEGVCVFFPWLHWLQSLLFSSTAHIWTTSCIRETFGCAPTLYIARGRIMETWMCLVTVVWGYFVLIRCSFHYVKVISYFNANVIPVCSSSHWFCISWILFVPHFTAIEMSIVKFYLKARLGLSCCLDWFVSAAADGNRWLTTSVVTLQRITVKQQTLELPILHSMNKNNYSQRSHF